MSASATSAVSVATFAAVLAEAFTAVTMASMQTNQLIGGLRRARALGRANVPATPQASTPVGGSTALTTGNIRDAVGTHEIHVTPSPGAPPVALDIDTLELLQSVFDDAFRPGPLPGLEEPAGAPDLPVPVGLDDQIRRSVVIQGLKTLGEELGMRLGPGAKVTADFARELLARVRMVMQGNRFLGESVARQVRALAALGAGSDEVDLFVAKSARIHAEFEFQVSSEKRFRVGQTGEQAGASAAMHVVSLAPGFSSLYQSSSSNRITVDVEFALTNVKL